MQLYFPMLFEDAGTKEYYDILRKRTLLMIESIINEEDVKELEEFTNELYTYNKPQNYAGPNGLDVQSDKHFESLCINLNQNLHIQSKKMNVIEFYTAYEALKEQIKQNERANKRQ